MRCNVYPLMILYVDSNEEVIVNHPNEIRSGRTFKVLMCNCSTLNNECKHGLRF